MKGWKNNELISRSKSPSEKGEVGGGGSSGRRERNALLAYPAQCNFSGLKYPLQWIAPVQIGHLEGISQMDQFYLDSLEQQDVQVIKNSSRLQTLAPRCSKCLMLIEQKSKHIYSALLYYILSFHPVFLSLLCLSTFKWL